ncbi:hypothetical protein FOA52_011488 [Chlamydomonas sp. UWO 241]|nr:hypothetical protein FOA52_005797 [Chlamydomonas sp. UWO 241]KAG1656344.1 hypothetical protein FOA52_011488 [Chlamydomonas sp. UWO 241]
MRAAKGGHVDAMRLLLNHASADVATMLIASSGGWTALMLDSRNGHVDAMRLMLDHPSATPAAMLVFDSTHEVSALIAAAEFAAKSSPHDGHAPTTPCAPLLLLLCSVTVALQPSDAHQAHMTRVVEVLSQARDVEGEEEDEDDEEQEQKQVTMFDDDQPDDARDECVRLLLVHGARGFNNSSPVMWRIIREYALMARVPQLINDAVVGLAISKQQQP